MRKAARFAMTVIMMLLILTVPRIAYGAGADNHNGGIVKVTGDIHVNEEDTVTGDVTTVWGNIYVDGSVTGNVVTVFGNITVNGKVLGDVTTVRGKITQGPNSKIIGNTIEALGGASSPSRYSGFRPGIGLPSFLGFGNFIISLVLSLITLLLASLIYLIMPVKISEMANTMENTMGRRIGIGFLGLIGSPIVMMILTILLAITIIGIILIPFLWIGYLVVGLIALVPVYMFVGTKIGEVLGGRKISGYGAIAAGILSVWLVKSLISIAGIFAGGFIGVVNVIISLILFVLGMGTLLDYIFSGKKQKPAFAGNIGQGGGPAAPAWVVNNNTVKENSDEAIKEDTTEGR